MDLDLLIMSIFEAHTRRSELHLENIVSAYYTIVIETGALLDLGIWSNCAKFVVNFNTRPHLIPVVKQEGCSCSIGRKLVQIKGSSYIGYL